MGSVRRSAEIELERVAVGWRPGAKIMQDDPRQALWHVPVVGLVQVIVQADDRSRLTVTTIALHHLATLTEPGPTVGLDEVAALVTVDVRVDDIDARDAVGLDDLGHACQSSSMVQ